MNEQPQQPPVDENGEPIDPNAPRLAPMSAEALKAYRRNRDDRIRARGGDPDRNRGPR
jgi:hypothetical protein